MFALLALICELTGRSVTVRVDHAFHVTPLAAPMASYYPFLLAAIRVLGALAVAGVAWRLVRAHGTAAAGEALLRVVGHRRPGGPCPRIRLTPRLWLASFGASSLWYLVQENVDRVSRGGWPGIAPWLHTDALPVFAVLSIVLALGWSIGRDWLADVEEYAAFVIACVCRAFGSRRSLPQLRRYLEVRAPRRLFGVVFESRPPPLAA